MKEEIIKGEQTTDYDIKHCEHNFVPIRSGEWREVRKTKDFCTKCTAIRILTIEEETRASQS